MSDAYRTALVGSLSLGGCVMTAAFVLVSGLPERMPQDTNEEAA